MSKTFVSYNNIFSSLGFDSKTVVENISKGNSGLEKLENASLLPEPFCASMISSEKIKNEFSKIGDASQFTKLEQMMILSLKDVIDASKIPLNEKVGLLVSTTKGNIDVLEKENNFPESRAYLSELGKIIQNFFGFKNEAIVLSNACVSGVLSVSVAKQFISEKKYDHVFITSGDLVSKFILSGFNSFQALSPEPCKPYDKNRVGINLGEVSASALVTSSEKNLPKEAVEILGNATCNDANHISGPSRTGEGLFRSVKAALKEANLNASEIDYISAHGTATTFNDEMEAIAFNRLGMKNVPINSLKGYFGHTLGASGLLETIVGMHFMEKNMLFSSKGFSDLGVSKSINIIKQNTPKSLNTFLKTASGFGGCNTAVIFKKQLTNQL
ncbi:3-oxoacyl-(acyl-carrier-protein) synthase [Aequorivita sublithincola DSM 14238]|uniref:3-oxoacyl-(Acyl-carrier-protein) synthase n=1 Tax=Aequorivita sublithincola (strain DSM 14238 / LMG 21431 / ACAM 643 / 9-3) TaxID=746697 RepID=I3YTV9_AEQSU|nr:beta-ketoacyl synthase N-terminal-like domain-containing protein [Aequorivita sublithincola]AFL80427.1 3-oxoacyl-(acyl-carrier-protein) synthase [Aequorivita sublithincola DSM 14238]